MAEFIEDRLNPDDIPVTPGAGVAPEASAASVGRTSTSTTNAASFSAAPDIESLNDYMNFFDMPSGISEQGHAFISALTKGLTNPVKNSGKHAWNDIRVTKLRQPNDSLAVINSGYAVVIIMAESNYNEDYPVIHCNEIAAENLGSMYPGITPISFLIIAPEEYGRADNFETFIRNLFVAVLEPRHANIDTLSKSILTFSDNPREYEEALLKLSPHAVPFRHDSCLTIYSQKRQQNNYNNQTNWFIPENENYFKSAANQSRKPIACISAWYEPYKISPDPANYNMGITIHINIESALIADELIPVWINVAIKRFMLNDAWKTYFKSSPFNAHGDRINLGHLFPDGKGGRFEFVDIEGFDRTTNELINNVQVVLDIPEGRARLPGLWKYLSNKESSKAEIINDFVRFNKGTGIQPYTSVNLPYTKYEGCTQYRGTYQFGNKSLDTANIDYLNEYPRHPDDALKCEKLLLKKINPILAVQDQKQFEPSMRLLYTVDSIAIHPDFYIWMDKCMPQLNGLVQTQSNGLANVTGAMANGAAWKQFINQGQYNYGGGNSVNVFNRMDPIYGTPWGKN